MHRHGGDIWNKKTASPNPGMLKANATKQNETKRNERPVTRSIRGQMADPSHPPGQLSGRGRYARLPEPTNP